MRTWKALVRVSSESRAWRTGSTVHDVTPALAAPHNQLLGMAGPCPVVEVNPSSVWVRGEIDGLQMRGAHTYFALVEDGENGRAVLNVSLFAPMRRNLTPLLKRCG